MIGPNGNGGGGIALKIIRAASALTLPATAAANTIAVITETEITGWVFSATAPETPAEGVVWFATGTRSPVAVNVLKKNGIWIYPASCQQYVSGVWVAKTAKTYQSGAWVEWLYWLYDTGSKKVELRDIKSALYGTETTITWGDDAVELSVYGPSSFTVGTAIAATGLMDVSGYSKLSAYYESIDRASPKFSVSVSTAATPTPVENGLGSDHIAVASITEAKSSAGVLTLDLSELTETEVCCCVSVTSTNRDRYKGGRARVRRFWLE